MRYKLLGRTGLRVSEICLGTMTFGEEWGWGSSKEESKKVFDACTQADGNFLDTANRYTEGTSEEYLGEFIASEREHFVIATKYTLYARKGDPNASGNHRKNLAQSLEASLKRLNTDYIDLFWVHAWDYMTPVDEVMCALDDMARALDLAVTPWAPEQLRENLGCLEFTLDDDTMTRLDEISKIELWFPHDFLESEIRKDLVYGGTFDQIDHHRGGTKRGH